MANIINLPTAEQFDTLNGNIAKIAQAQKIEDLWGTPGSKTLFAGDREAGFFGFVQVADFITGDALATAIGLSDGTSQNSDTPWIKYIFNGKICFTPLKALRNTVTWDAIYAAGSVYGTGSIIGTGEQWMLDNDENYGDGGIARVTQGAQVDVGGLAYKVRLFRGAANDPLDSYADSDRGAIGVEDEWNAIMLPLHERAKLQNWNYPAYAGITEYWGTDLTDMDMNTHYTLGSGSYSWCQETRDTLEGVETAYRRAFRGYHGVSGLYSNTSSLVSSNYGFRPVLELIV